MFCLLGSDTEQHFDVAAQTPRTVGAGPFSGKSKNAS
jgi:hypothetical protein